MTGRTMAALRLLTWLALELAALAALARDRSAMPPLDRSIMRWWKFTFMIRSRGISTPCRDTTPSR